MNTTLRLLIAGLVGLIFIVSCNDTGKTADSGLEYYRQLKFSETPYDLIQGSHPITAEEAKTVNHYKFTNDESGRLVTVEFMRGDELLEYSQSGAARIAIKYEDHKEIHTYFDHNNEQMEMWAGYYMAIYELGEDGMRKKLTFADAEGNAVENSNNIAWFDWNILPDGQIQEKRFTMEGEETVLNPYCPFYELRFTYDEEGKVTRMANFQGDTMYNCTVENCGDIGVSYFSFDYNEAGDLTAFGVYSLTNQLSNLYWGWARFENKYDDYGNQVENVMFDQDDEPVSGMSTPVTQSVYDEHGSLVEQLVMNINRELINNPRSGVAITKYNYNELGHPKDTLRFDAKMEAI